MHGLVERSMDCAQRLLTLYEDKDGSVLLAKTCKCRVLLVLCQDLNGTITRKMVPIC